MWVSSDNTTRCHKLEIPFLLNSTTLEVASPHNSSAERSTSAAAEMRWAEGSSDRTKNETRKDEAKPERSYQCDQCNAAFTQSHDLSKHVWYVAVLPFYFKSNDIFMLNQRTKIFIFSNYWLLELLWFVIKNIGDYSNNFCVCCFIYFWFTSLHSYFMPSTWFGIVGSINDT